MAKVKGKNQPFEEEKTILEFEDEDDDFVLDDDADGNEDEDFDGDADADFKLEAMLNESVAKFRKQANAYTDKRIEQVNTTLKKHQSILKQHSQILENHADEISNLKETVNDLKVNRNLSSMQMPQSQEAPQQKHDNILDATLGTIGGVAHGIVDTAAFLCESVVDLVTLGRAKRPR